MANDPAFLFYPGDYLRDTQCLSEPAQVAYDRIMCEHMRNICISQAQLDFFTKRLNDDQKLEVVMVLTKIDSGYQIKWVAESIAKRRDYSESRRKNRSKPKKTSSSYDSHMENEIENENEIVNEIKSSIKKESLQIVSRGAYDESLGDVERWTKDILEGNDPLFLNMVRNQNLILNGQLEPLARDHLGKCARYNWHERITTQQAFRHSLLNYVAENLTTAKAAKNGKSKVTLEELNTYRKGNV